MRRTYGAEYSVEAALVMSIVIFSMVVLIHEGFEIYERTLCGMVAEYGVEVLRHSDDSLETEIRQRQEEELRNQLERFGYQVYMEQNGDKVTAGVKKADWEYSVTKSRFKPEELLRLLTIVEDK